MTVTLNDRCAVADFLDHVAELVRHDKVDGLSIAMGADGKARVSVTFAPGQEQELAGTPPEEADTEPGIKLARKVTKD